MGNFATYKCTNPECKFESWIEDGFSIQDCSYHRKIEERIKSGKINSPKTMRMFNKYPYSTFLTGGVYMCPSCKNRIGDKRPYGVSICDPEHILDSKRIYFFPFGRPYCSKCHRHMIFNEILNCDEYKCPKCGSDMKIKGFGWFD